MFKICKIPCRQPKNKAKYAKNSFTTHNYGHRVPVTIVTNNSRSGAVQRRFFADDANNNTKVDARQKMMYLPNLLSQGLAEVAPAPPIEQDATANVYLAQIPSNYVNEKQMCEVAGKNAIYRSTNSYYTLKFEKPYRDMSLDEYVNLLQTDFYSTNPYGAVSTVFLHPSLVENWNKPSLQYTALFFDRKSPLIPTSQRVVLHHQRAAEMTLVLKTPGGFWSITCVSSYFHLSSQKDAMFGNFLKNLRVDIKENVPQTQNNAHVELPKMSTSSRKQRKRVKPTLTQQATVGEINFNRDPSIGSIDDSSLD